MIKISLVILSVFSIFTFKSCSEDDSNSAGYRLIGEYEGEVYYKSYDFSLFEGYKIYKLIDGGFELIYELEMTEVVENTFEIIDNYFLISKNYKEEGLNKYYLEYLLVDINTLEVIEIPLYDNKYTYLDNRDGNILFTIDDGKKLYSYNIELNEIVYQFNPSLANTLQEVYDGFYLGDEIYYRTRRASEYYSVRTDINFVSIHNNFDDRLLYSFVDNTNEHIYVYNSDSNGNSTITKFDNKFIQLSSMIREFEYYYKLTDEAIIGYNNWSENGEFEIYDLDFNYLRTIDINTSCDEIEIINDDMVECSRVRTKGSILVRYYVRKEIYSLIDGELLFDSDWVKVGNQSDFID